MDIVLLLQQEFGTTYLDIIHSSTWPDHLHHLKSILGALRKAELTANPQKCHLGLTEAQYLGYRISQVLLMLQDKKVEAMQKYLQPTTKHQIYVCSWGWLDAIADLCLTSPL